MMNGLRNAISKFGRATFPVAFKKLDIWRAAGAERRRWDQRIADVIACPDNARLSRVVNAGEILSGYQVMHNGLRVAVNGYYGEGITRMLSANRGSHEPQEEVIFDRIIHTLPASSTMVELGAYWGFYSMWFCQAVKQAKVFLVEPAAENLLVGKTNFRENGYTGDFTHAYIGAIPGRSEDGMEVVSVESFLAEKGLARLNLLHADVQGCELEMLHGSSSLFEQYLIDYVFLSTHTMDLHAKCVEFLCARDYNVLVSVDLVETHSIDGVLVACSPLVTPPNFAPPSKKTRGGPLP